MQRITFREIKYIQYEYLFIWIVKMVKEIAKSKNKYFDYLEIDKNIKYKDCQNVDEVNIDLECNTIIIVIKYQSKNKPYKVIFCKLIDEMTTLQYYINKN